MVAKSERSAFSLIEVLVVVGILGLLAGLLLPAVQAAREAMRRAACGNNLRQINLALSNYQSLHASFPIGARHQGNSFGPSWLVGILPFIEEDSLFQRFDMRSSGNGHASTNRANGAISHNVLFSVLRCPSSPLPAFADSGGFKIASPSYVGIAGSVSDNNLVESRVAPCCVIPAPSNSGQLSAGGVLIPNGTVRLQDVLDGSSKTISVGEISNYAYDSKGTARNISGGFPNGWFTGTNAKGSPPAYGTAIKAPSWNITTIKYAVGGTAYDRPGIGENHGPNNPLLSAHTRAVNCAFVDGSVRGLSHNLDLLVLRRLATRDDRQLVTE